MRAPADPGRAWKILAILQYAISLPIVQFFPPFYSLQPQYVNDQDFPSPDTSFVAHLVSSATCKHAHCASFYARILLKSRSQVIYYRTIADDC